MLSSSATTKTGRVVLSKPLVRDCLKGLSSLTPIYPLSMNTDDAEQIGLSVMMISRCSLPSPDNFGTQDLHDRDGRSDL